MIMRRFDLVYKIFKMLCMLFAIVALFLLAADFRYDFNYQSSGFTYDKWTGKCFCWYEGKKHYIIKGSQM